MMHGTMNVKKKTKFEVNGLVKPRTGVYIVLNSTFKDRVNLTKSGVIIFVIVSMMWVRMMPRWPQNMSQTLSKSIITLTSLY
jgi:predicted ATP-binding protein involved in virulence